MGKFRMFAAVTAPACAMLALAQPAIAAEGAAAKMGASATQSEAPQAAASRKFCLSQVPAANTRIARRECKTGQQWSEEGLQVSVRRK